MTPEEVIARCDENTIGVVSTLGVTFNGKYEPVYAVAKALDLFQEKLVSISLFILMERVEDSWHLFVHQMLCGISV